MVQPERVADAEHALADLEGRGGAAHDGDEARARFGRGGGGGGRAAVDPRAVDHRAKHGPVRDDVPQLQHRDVAVGVLAHELGGQFGAGGERHAEVVGAADHVVVGDDVRRVPHQSRARAGGRLQRVERERVPALA